MGKPENTRYPKERMRKFLLLIPAIIFGAQIFWVTTVSDNLVINDGPLSHIPVFTLPSLDIDGIILDQHDLEKQDIRVINFFASWCGPCKVEHPLLMELSEENIDMLGIAFQDNTVNAKAFLKQMENPYLLTALDQQGQLGLEWEISSIPQTFVIDNAGNILFHRSGRLKQEDINENILPLINGSD